MIDIEFEPIGQVESRFEEPTDHQIMRKEESIIVINSKFEEGLEGIEDRRYLQILFYFHKSEGYQLYGPRRFGEKRGVFASRSPKRPVPIGSTVVELIKREGRRLKVKGLDAIDGTPILDIKPYTPSFDEK